MWYWYAATTMISFAAMALILTALKKSGMSEQVILVVVFGLGFLFFLSHSLIKRQPVLVNARTVTGLIAAALLAYLGNLFYVKALAAAPNAGYAIAIIGSQALIVSLVSIPLFDSQFSALKGIGVLLCIVGIAFLSV